MYAHRERMVREAGARLIVHTNAEGLAAGVSPFTHGSSYYTDVMKTEALRQALDAHGFDVIFGGARRDEEASRAKERICSFRSPATAGIPKAQRPELWSIYNLRIHPGRDACAFSRCRTGPSSTSGATSSGSPSRSSRSTSPRSARSSSAMARLIMVDDERFPLARRRAAAAPARAVPHAWLLSAERRHREPGHDRRRDHRRDGGRRGVRAAGTADRHRPARLDGEEEAGGLLLSAPLLRLITCGSVDDGKSTLIGRLLYESRGDLRGSAARARSRLAPSRHAGHAPRFRAAARWPAGRARAGHHHRRRLSILRHAGAAVHRRRHPRARAVHAQHGHRRLDRRSRHHPGRRAQGRAARRPAGTRAFSR